MNQRLLIVEELLRNIETHWFEFLRMISKGANKTGWKVDVACNKNASTQVINSFSAFQHFNILIIKNIEQRPKARVYLKPNNFCKFLLNDNT